MSFNRIKRLIKSNIQCKENYVKHAHCPLAHVKSANVCTALVMEDADNTHLECVVFEEKETGNPASILDAHVMPIAYIVLVPHAVNAGT